MATWSSPFQRTHERGSYRWLLKAHDVAFTYQNRETPRMGLNVLKHWKNRLVTPAQANNHESGAAMQTPCPSTSALA